MERLSEYIVRFGYIFLCLLIYYFVPITITYYFLYVRNKEKFRQYKIQQKYPTVKQIRREIKFAVIALVIFSVAGTFIYTYAMKGYTSVYFNISDYGYPYFFASLFITIFVNDTLFYWSHRFMHLKAVFRHVHLEHHRSNCPSPFASFSFGPAEAVIHTAVYAALIFFIPIHPVMFVVFHLYNMATNLAGHAGFEFMPEKVNKHWFFNWQNTVTNHEVHHKDFNCNYGNYFIFWDKIMHTLSGKKHIGSTVVKREPLLSSQ